jgi:uncharacterized protein (TIGR02246 family)
MKRLPFLLFVLAAACAPPPAPPPPVPPAPDPAEVRRAIEDANAKATAAMVKGDLSAVFDAAYANDAVLLMSNLPKAVGRDAIIAAWGTMTKQAAVKSATFRTEDVLIGGDLAVETGAYEMTLVPKKGPEVTDTGKYLTVWRKQPDGSWKVIRDAGNTNGPPSK